MLVSGYLAGGSPFEDKYFPEGGGNVVDHTGEGLGEKTALKCATVFRAVSVLAAAVATMPIGLFRRRSDGGKEPVRNAPERLLLGMRPNPGQNSFVWRHHLMARLLLGGNYFAQRLTDGAGQTSGLWPLDSQRMRLDEVKPDGSLVYEYTTKSGQPRKFTQDEVLHCRGYTIDGLMGISVLELMREHVAQANLSKRQRTRFIKRELRPSAVFTHPKTLRAPAYKRLEKSLARNYSGPESAGKAVILEEGMNLAPWVVSPKDAQFVESDRFAVEDFLRFIGVPGVLCGYADKTATFASAEAFFQSFKDHSLFPWTKNLELELTLFLLGLQDEFFFEFNLDAMLRPDSTARANFYRALVELGILTRNEVRALENRNPLPGLDQPLTPLNMGTGGAPAGSSAHLAAIVREAAAALLRKEVVAMVGDGAVRKGAAVRFAGDGTAWQRAVRDFYSEHAAAVARRLQIPMHKAERYCQGQRDALLQDGIGVCETWNAERLVALALE